MIFIVKMLVKKEWAMNFIVLFSLVLICGCGHQFLSDPDDSDIGNDEYSRYYAEKYQTNKELRSEEQVVCKKGGTKHFLGYDCEGFEEYVRFHFRLKCRNYTQYRDVIHFRYGNQKGVIQPNKVGTYSIRLKKGGGSSIVFQISGKSLEFRIDQLKGELYVECK